MRRWVLLGLFWPALALVGWIMASLGGRAHGSIPGLLLLASWIGGIVTSFVIRDEYEALRDLRVGDDPAWPVPTPISRGWSVKYALCAFVVTFGGTSLLGLILRDGPGIRPSVGLGVLIVDATLLAALVPLVRRRGSSARDFGLRATRPMASLGLAFLVLVAYFAFGGVYAVLFIGHSARDSANALAQIRHLGTVGTILAIIAAGVSAPVVEEIFFRGMLYRSLRNRLPTAAAVLIAGSLFGLVHVFGYPLITIPVKAVFGVLACLLYEKTGSLLPGIGVHGFVDASAIDLALTGNDDVVLIIYALLIAGMILRTAVVNSADMLRHPALVNAPE